MLNVTFDLDFDDLIKDMGDLAKKQIPYAAHVALNESVYKATIDVRKQLSFFIQGGAVPFTKRGVNYKKSKNKHHLKASIYIPDAQWDYMQHIIDGNDKSWPRSKHGISMPIYKNTKFNKYGNIPGRRKKEGVWRDMLDQIGGSHGAPRGKRGKNVFAATINGVTGIWQRGHISKKGNFTTAGKSRATNLKLLIKFTHGSVYYKKRLPFKKLAMHFGFRHFDRAFDYHLRRVVNSELRKVKIR